MLTLVARTRSHKRSRADTFTRKLLRQSFSQKFVAHKHQTASFKQAQVPALRNELLNLRMWVTARAQTAQSSLFHLLKAGVKYNFFGHRNIAFSAFSLLPLDLGFCCLPP